MNEDKIRCWVCGEPVKHLSPAGHLAKHNMSSEDYKEYCREREVEPVMSSKEFKEKKKEEMEERKVSKRPEVKDKIRKFRKKQTGEKAHQWIDPDEIVEDVKKVAEDLDQSYISLRQYTEKGIYSETGIYNHFESWNNVLKAAGLKTRNQINNTGESYD